MSNISNKGTVTRWRRFLGDTDSISVQLGGITSITQGATVTARAARKGVATDLPATVIDAEDRIISITLTTWLADPTTVVGIYQLAVTLEDITWPEFGEAQIEVASIPASPVPTP